MTDKERFIAICKEHIHRPGIERLLAWLEKNDFFTAPASSRYHLSVPGGLVKHSLNVYDEMQRLCGVYAEHTKISSESIAIMALFHDLCKVNMYKTTRRAQMINGELTEVPGFNIDEKFPFGGHGSKSLYLIQQFMPLTPEEAVAINCHMGLTDNARSVSAAYEQFHAAWILHVADEAATFILEGSRG